MGMKQNRSTYVYVSVFIVASPQEYIIWNEIKIK